jgi:monomeric isocitrate dehydrogenase
MNGGGLFETGAEWICSKHVEHLLMKDTYDGIPW